jgi:hypothetical protein
VLVRSGPRMVDAARGIVECLRKLATT